MILYLVHTIQLASERSELDYLAQAQGHPNVVVLHGVFAEASKGQERWLIAMQLCQHDLFERVQRAACTEPEAVELSLGLLSALAHLHALRIVHRDVKADARRSPGPQGLDKNTFSIRFRWLFDGVSWMPASISGERPLHPL